MRVGPALLISLCTACAGADAEQPSGPRLPYELDVRPMLPFPSDEILVESSDTPTGYRIEVGAPGETLGDADEAIFLFGDDFVETLETLDGWSTLGPAFASTGTPADLESAREHAFIFDVASSQRVPAKISVIRGETDYGRPQAWIEARPLVPLVPSTRHALILLDGLRSETGERFERSITFDALFRGAARIDRADPDRWARAAARQEGLVESLSRAGIDAKDVLLADPYTTLSIDEETDQMVDLVRARPAPVINLDADGDGAPDRYFDPSDDPRRTIPNRPYPSLRATLRVTFAIPSFRADDDSRLMVDARAAEVQREESVEALVLLPEGEGPFPVAVFHHGVSARKEVVFTMAEDLCALGFAVVAIDATLHGYRTDKPGNAGVRFLNVVSPDLVLDNFRTAEVDQVTVVRAIDELAKLDLLGTNESLLDPDRLAYVGVSLGSIVGAAVVGLEPRFGAAVLFVGGGTLLEFFDRVLSGFQFDGFPTRLFTTVAQTVLDRGDPSNYARRSMDTQILLIQAMDDTVVPAGATASLARAMDLPLLDQQPLRRRGWTQFSGSHELPYDDREPNHVAARRQAWQFLESWLATGEGIITQP